MLGYVTYQIYGEDSSYIIPFPMYWDVTFPHVRMYNFLTCTWYMEDMYKISSEFNMISDYEFPMGLLEIFHTLCTFPIPPMYWKKAGREFFHHVGKCSTSIGKYIAKFVSSYFYTTRGKYLPLEWVRNEGIFYDLSII